MKVVATARVQIVVEIRVPSTWGAECSIEQIHRQATDSAVGILLTKCPSVGRLIGEPKITAIIVDPDSE